jgi:Putative Ig domain
MIIARRLRVILLATLILSAYAFAGGPLYVTNSRDSYAPPESLQTSVTLSVQLPGLQINSAIGQSKLVLNKPYTGYFYGTGGTPPYLFQLTAGALPPGLQLTDPVAGLVTGTPTISGTYTFTVGVSDSTGGGIQPATFTAIVAPALGRNDTPAHPTAIGNGSIQASIRPLWIRPAPSLPTPTITR